MLRTTHKLLHSLMVLMEKNSVQKIACILPSFMVGSGVGYYAGRQNLSKAEDENRTLLDATEAVQRVTVEKPIEASEVQTTEVIVETTEVQTTETTVETSDTEKPEKPEKPKQDLITKF